MGSNYNRNRDNGVGFKQPKSINPTARPKNTDVHCLKDEQLKAEWPILKWKRSKIGGWPRPSVGPGVGF